jgi:hypothetical protein
MEREPCAHRPRMRFGEVTGAVIGVTAPVAVRHEHLDELAPQLLAPIAEQPPGLRVDEHDQPARIDDHQRVQSGLQQPLKRTFRPTRTVAHPSSLQPHTNERSRTYHQSASTATSHPTSTTRFARNAATLAGAWIGFLRGRRDGFRGRALGERFEQSLALKLSGGRADVLPAAGEKAAHQRVERRASVHGLSVRRKICEQKPFRCPQDAVGFGVEQLYLAELLNETANCFVSVVAGCAGAVYDVLSSGERFGRCSSTLREYRRADPNC